MDVPFFVAFAVILLVGRYLPLALPLDLRWALDFVADNAARPPARVAKCAISVAIGGLALLVTTQQHGPGAAGGIQAGVAMVVVEARVLWFNSAALFLGTLLGLADVAVALDPQAPFVLQVAVEHLAVVTEIVAINAFALNLCVFFKIFEV